MVLGTGYSVLGSRWFVSKMLRPQEQVPSTEDPEPVHFVSIIIGSPFSLVIRITFALGDVEMALIISY